MPRFSNILRRNKQESLFVSDDTLILTRAIRVALFIVSALGIVLFMAPQATEVIAIELEGNDFDRIGRTFAAIYLLSALLLVYIMDMMITLERNDAGRVGSVGTKLHLFGRKDLHVGQSLRMRSGKSKFVPLAVACAPIALAFIMVLTSQSADREVAIAIPNSSPIHLGVRTVAILMLVIGIGGLNLLSFILYNATVALMRGSIAVSNARRAITNAAIPLGLAVTVGSLTVLFFSDPVSMSIRTGPIALLCIGLSAALVVFSLGIKWGIVLRRPILLYCAGIISGVFIGSRIAGLSWVDYEAYHLPVQDIPTFANFVPSPTALEQWQKRDPSRLHSEISAWRGLRDPLAAYQTWVNLPEVPTRKTILGPIVIAAQGGGIYAAYHSALSLARLQDRCPVFSDHVFAVSGVSGGGLGASAFLASVQAVRQGQLLPTLAKKGFSLALPKCGDPVDGSWRGPHEILVDAFLRSDFLSPVIFGALFLDLPNYAIPYKVFGGSGNTPWPDRAGMLEVAIQENWSRVTKEYIGPLVTNFFKQSIFDYRQVDHRLPNLILTGTVVETGDPVIAAPIALAKDKGDGNRLIYIPFLSPGVDMSVAAAVVMSSRFPFIAPAAVLAGNFISHVRPLKHVRVVDGGYFENSGSLALIELIAQIGAEKPSAIVFTHRDNLTYDNNYLTEFLSPLRAALNAGTVVGLEYIRNLHKLCPDANYANYELIDRDFYLPLAWYLSESNLKKIKERSGFNQAFASQSQSAISLTSVEAANNQSATKVVAALRAIVVPP